MIALEILITDLGITEHMASLSNWRDELLREKAAELQAVTADLAAAQKAFTDLEAFRVAMVAKVTATLQSGDPVKFAELATEFLTPEQEKIRAEKMAQLDALKLELGIE